VHCGGVLLAACGLREAHDTLGLSPPRRTSQIQRCILCVEVCGLRRAP
jgi:hypothetical protein